MLPFAESEGTHEMSVKEPGAFGHSVEQLGGRDRRMVGRGRIIESSVDHFCLDIGR